MPPALRLKAKPKLVPAGPQDVPAKEQRQTIDLSVRKQNTVFFGIDEKDNAGFSVVASGDVDGDGKKDLLIGAEDADGADNRGGNFAGEVYLVYGRSAEDFRNKTELSKYADVTFQGTDPNGYLGTSVAMGDLDGDGFDDIILGSVAAPNNDPLLVASGIVYVFYGGPRGRLPREVNLGSKAELEIWGSAGDVAGVHLATGDIDGDGKDDLVIGAPSADGPNETRTEAGEVYVIFGASRAQLGRRRLLPSEADLVIYGRKALDHAGWGLGTGDLNGDGKAEVLIGAIDADGPKNKEACGEVYIVWGDERSKLGRVRDLLTLEGAVVLYGIDEADLAGFSLAAGDIDHDGKDDLIIGALTADGLDNKGGDLIGEVYIVFGREKEKFSKEMRLDVDADVTIFGVDKDDHAGHTVVSGDVNGDGYADIVIAAPSANGFGENKPDSGEVYILLGRPRKDFEAKIELAKVGPNFLILGAEAFGGAGHSLAAGDLDGDGLDDVLIGAPHAPGKELRTREGGRTYVLFGNTLKQQTTTSDEVEITRAEFDPDTKLLTVEASSSLGPTAEKTAFEVFLYDGSTQQQVTHNSDDNSGLVLRSGKFTWEQWDGQDTEIMFTDGRSNVQITNNTLNDFGPQLDGSHITWMTWDGHDFEIFLYDGARSVVQVTNNDMPDLYPQIDKGEIVWMGYDGHDYEIFLYRNGLILQLTNNDTDDINPRISDGMICWAAVVNGKYQIFLSNGTDVLQLTDSEFSTGSPVIDDGMVVWAGFDGHDYEIFYYSNGVVEQVTRNDVNDLAPQVSAGRIVWQAGRGRSREIFLFAEGQVTRLTENDVADINPRIDKGQVVWQTVYRLGPDDKDKPPGEIFLYDGTQVKRLTNDEVEDSDPWVSDGQVAWRRQIVSASLKVVDFGSLKYDKKSTLFSGTFLVKETPKEITVESPFGGKTTVPVTTVRDARKDLEIVQLTDNGKVQPDDSPRIDGGQIVWSGHDGNDYEIFFHDGDKGWVLTDNFKADINPQISKGQVTWQGWDGNDWEIFLFDGKKTTRLTNNNFDDVFPQIDNGKVVWQGSNGHTDDIYLYEDGKTTQLSDNNHDNVSPRINNGIVVWQGFDGTDQEIYLYDGGRVQQITYNDHDDTAPEIDGGQVVWQGVTGLGTSIFLYADRRITQITSSKDQAYLPQIHHGTIAWSQWDQKDYEIFMYQNGAIKQITDNAVDDVLSQTRGGSIVWLQGPSSNREVFLYDGASEKTTQITKNLLDDKDPQIENDRVVWSGNDDGRDFDIFIYDSTKKTTTKFTNNGNAAPDEYPHVGTGSIAWHGWDGSDNEIYLHDGVKNIQLTNDSYEEFQPRVSKNWVVWQGRDGIPKRVDLPGEGEGGLGFKLVGGDFEIYLYDGKTTKQLSDNEFDDIAPQVDNGQVVWLGWDGTDYEVFYYNGVAPFQLTNNRLTEDHVRISDGQIVWQGWDGHDFEIFLFDGNKYVQLTDNQTDDFAPEIHHGIITWFGSDGHDFEIFVYRQGIVTQLTSNEGDDVYPQIHEGKIVWQGWDGNDFEIFLYDPGITKPVILQLTDNDQLDERPRINSGQVVWQGSNGRNLEIFYYDGSKIYRVTKSPYDDVNPEISNGQITWQGFNGVDFDIYKVTIPK